MGNVTIDGIMADIEETAAKMTDARAAVPLETAALNIERLYSMQTELRGCIHTLVRTKDCTAVKNIVSGRRGVFKSADIFVKRAIRKLTLWLIEPAWKQQKMFNIALTSSVSRMAEMNEELMKGIIYLSKELDEMKK